MDHRIINFLDLISVKVGTVLRISKTHVKDDKNYNSKCFKENFFSFGLKNWQLVASGSYVHLRELQEERD